MRQNGFTLPISLKQLAVLLLHINYLSVYVLVFILNSSIEELQILLALESVQVIGFLYHWYKCSSIDPGDDTVVVSENCVTNRLVDTKTCLVCKKLIIGIDHHCVWLNTCIGKNNIVHYVLFSILGMSVSWTIFTSYVYLLATHYTTLPDYVKGIVYFGLGSCVSWCISYTNLVYYQYKLIIIEKKSTYGYLLTKREARQEQFRRQMQLV